MSEVRDIRVLAQRADLEFQVPPNLTRRRTWWAGIWLSVGCLGLLVIAYLCGNNEIYSAGPLSDAHAFIANDCRQCHTTWQPARRLWNHDAYSTEHSSIDNLACLKCHSANEHHPNQLPAHRELTCASCHREHQGKQVLADVTDKQCLHCHQDLKTTRDSSTKFAKSITGFDAAQGHPEFHLWRRLASTAPNEIESILISEKERQQFGMSDLSSNGKQSAYQDVLKSLKPGEARLKNSTSGLRDRTELKFNHATHFNSNGVPDRNGKLEVLAKNCQACHVADDAGRYMLPVHFESHCARCHPLWFDNQNHPNEEVPHERWELIRGYLTEKYTLAALKGTTRLQEHTPENPFPGPTGRSPLNAKQAASIEQRVAQAEKFVLENTRQQLQGGCKFCHTLESKEPNGPIDIVPPNQPGRWLHHSQFDHAAHRTFDCLQCHQEVNNSRPERESAISASAADVLIPKIADCQACHASPAYWAKSAKVNVLPNPSAHSPRAVSSRCTMCHTYHNKTLVVESLRDSKDPEPR